MILTSCRGVWKSSLGNSYFRDPPLTYWALLTVIRLFWISTKESSCLEGDKEWIEWDIHGVQGFCIHCGVDLLGVQLNGSVHLAQRCELDHLAGCHLQDLHTISVGLEDVIVGCGSSQALCVLPRSKLDYFILYLHTGVKKKVCGYLLALGTSVGICQPHVLDDSLLTVVQVPALCHMKAFRLLLLIDGIRGLAHPLGSGLTRKITLSLPSSVCNLCRTTFHKPPATHRSCASA